MSNQARAGIGVVLIALAIVLFVALKGSDDDDGEKRTATSETTHAQNGGPETGNTGATGNTGPTSPPIETIEIRNGAPVGGVLEIEVRSGDKVEFRVSSDEPGEIHVHGYEITEQVKAGGSVLIEFPATLEGGYAVELHAERSGEFEIASLAVNPG